MSPRTKELIKDKLGIEDLEEDEEVDDELDSADEDSNDQDNLLLVYGINGGEKNMGSVTLTDEPLYTLPIKSDEHVPVEIINVPNSVSN